MGRAAEEKAAADAARSAMELSVAALKKAEVERQTTAETAAKLAEAANKEAEAARSASVALETAKAIQAQVTAAAKALEAQKDANRAAAHTSLKNWRRALDDAREALAVRADHEARAEPEGH